MRMEIDFVEQLRQEGQVIGARQVLLLVLGARGLVPGRPDAARIEACLDLPTLERWARQAATAGSVEEALRGEAPGRAAPRRRRSAKSA